MRIAFTLTEANIVLRDAGLTDKTQIRHYHGLRKILPILESSISLMDMGEKVSEWIQTSWGHAGALPR